jgi:hypothetical protein
MIIPNRAEVKGAAMKTAVVRGLRRKPAAGTPGVGRGVTLKLSGRHAEFPFERDGPDQELPNEQNKIEI